MEGCKCLLFFFFIIIIILFCFCFYFCLCFCFLTSLVRSTRLFESTPRRNIHLIINTSISQSQSFFPSLHALQSTRSTSGKEPYTHFPPLSTSRSHPSPQIPHISHKIHALPPSTRPVYIAWWHTPTHPPQASQKLLVN